MKHKQTLYIAILAAVLLTTVAACYKDKGNYSYSATNKLTLALDTIKSNSTINMNQADTLRITPSIAQSLGKDESRFAYEWKIYNNSASASLGEPRIVIATSRNLAVALVAPNFVLGQRYHVTYTVTDTVTRVSTFFTFNVQVVNRFATGWMVLEDLPGGGDYSMILNSNVVEHKVFAQINPGVPMGEGVPVGMDIATATVDDGIISPGAKRIYIYHPNGGMELDYTTLQRKLNMQILFFNPPATLHPQGVSWWTYPTQTFYASFGTLVDNGKVYAAEIGGYPGAKKFGSALSMASNSNDYYAAREAWQGLSWPFIFDKKNRRFHIVRPTKLDDFPDAVSTVANLNDLQKDLVYMDESNVVRAYNAILKDDAGQRFLLRITFSSYDPVLTSFIQAMNAPEINDAAAYASSGSSPHIFYGTNNKLYRYEVTSNTTTQPFSFPAGESIVSMRCRNGSELMVATWNGVSGKVYKFSITNTGAITGDTYTNEYSGFGRIIDMRYKG